METELAKKALAIHAYLKARGLADPEHRLFHLLLESSTLPSDLEPIDTSLSVNSEETSAENSELD